ncbi:hypothetical protein AB1399_04610, partial [Hydrogenibacillus schlegelii]|uniref:hypothetical protein n=1 Tax=Hydrogenibacillus schlegelii TaxID=1484 RepID=UPI00349FD53B
RALDRVADRGFEIVFIAMQRAQDVEPALRVRAAMTRPAAVVRRPSIFGRSSASSPRRISSSACGFTP